MGTTKVRPVSLNRPLSELDEVVDFGTGFSNMHSIRVSSPHLPAISLTAVRAEAQPCTPCSIKSTKYMAEPLFLNLRSIPIDIISTIPKPPIKIITMLAMQFLHTLLVLQSATASIWSLSEASKVFDLDYNCVRGFGHLGSTEKEIKSARAAAEHDLRSMLEIYPNLDYAYSHLTAGSSSQECIQQLDICDSFTMDLNDILGDLSALDDALVALLSEASIWHNRRCVWWDRVSWSFPPADRSTIFTILNHLEDDLGIFRMRNQERVASKGKIFVACSWLGLDEVIDRFRHDL